MSIYERKVKTTKKTIKKIQSFINNKFIKKINQFYNNKFEKKPTLMLKMKQ